MPARGLILTYGNPSRGDDALGPAIFEMLEQYQKDTKDLNHVDIQTDFQLQIEHAVDLIDRQYVIFIDASVSCEEPFEFQPLLAEKDDSFTTHAMSPASVLAVYQQINRSDPPPAFLLTIRAHEFGLGKSMTEQAKTNLQSAFRYVVDLNMDNFLQKPPS